MKTPFYHWTFEIDNQALAVAHCLDGLENELNFAENGVVMFSIIPWDNGRERSMCWGVRKNSGPTLNIVVAEHRSRDGSVCAFKWEKNKQRFYPSSLREDGPFYTKGDYIGYDEVSKIADWVKSQIKSFLETH